MKKGVIRRKGRRTLGRGRRETTVQESLLHIAGKKRGSAQKDLNTQDPRQGGGQSGSGEGGAVIPDNGHQTSLGAPASHSPGLGPGVLASFDPRQDFEENMFVLIPPTDESMVGMMFHLARIVRIVYEDDIPYLIVTLFAPLGKSDVRACKLF